MDKLEKLKLEAAELIAGAKAGSLTSDQTARISTIGAEIEAAQAEAAAHKKSLELNALLQAGADAPAEKKSADDEAPARTIGEHFIKSLNGRSLKSPGTIITPDFVKAATDTQSVGRDEGAYGPLVTDVDREFVRPQLRRLTVSDLVSTGTVSGNSITYPVFGAIEGAPAMVAEGGQKPQIHFADPTWRTDRLGEVAVWFKLTDDMAEDVPYVVSEINEYATVHLQVKEEDQILFGNGTDPNLRGIFERSGVQSVTRDAADTVADSIFKAINLVSANSPFSADAVVMNPADYEELRLTKDANEQYYGGGFFTGAYGNTGFVEVPPVWGYRTVVTPAMPAKKVGVGNFASAKVFTKGGLRVESTNSHDDDFTNDKITVRIRKRLGLQVKYPSAFVELELTPAAG